MLQSACDSRDELLGQAANEYFEAVARGGTPLIADYAARFPDIADDIRRVFPALGLVGDSMAGAARLAPLTDGTDRQQLGDYRIVREIGRGGMGIVYEAEQLSLGRRVALKVLPFAAVMDDKAVVRFKNEARAAATLDHPNIVPIHAVGNERGVYYYAMQLIEGQSLAQMVEQLKARSHPEGTRPGARSENLQRPAPSSPLPADTSPIAHLSTLPAYSSRDYYRSVARLGVQAARALQHAHERGIVHRDIKPGNLMVQCSHLAPRDEAATSTGGGPKSHHAERDGYTPKVWITDFGLARINSDAGLTMTGDLLGTIRYMAPEQATGQNAVADHRADVYSLGVTLYELLALRPAFDGDDRHKLLKQIALDDPKPLRLWNAAIPIDLETIVAKATAKHPAERYRSADEFGDDLERFLEHRTIVARPPTILDRSSKWLQRRLALVVITGISLLALTTVLAVSMALVMRSETRAVAALEETSNLLYTTDMTLAFQTYEKGWTDEVPTILDRYRPTGQAPDRRGFEWHLLQSLVRRPASVTLAGHTGPVTELAVFPDRRRLASVGEDGTLRIWDVGARKLLRTIPICNEGLSSVAISPDGRYVAAGSTDASLARQRLEGTKQVETITKPDRSTTAFLCDLATNGRVSEVFHGTATVESLVFSPGGKQLAIGTRYHEVCHVSLDGKVLKRIPSTAKLDSLEYTPRSSRLLVPNRITRNSGQKGFLQLWSSDLSKVESEIYYHGADDSKITLARSSPCGNYIAAGQHYEANLFLYHLPSQRIVAEGPKFRDNLNDLAYSPDGESLAAGYKNGALQLLRLEKSEGTVSIEPGRIFKAHKGSVTCARFLTARALATCGSDGLIRIWNTAGPAVRDPDSPGESWEGPRFVAWKESLLDGPVTGIRLSPDGSQLLFSGLGVLCIDAHSGTLTQSHMMRSNGGSAWSPGGDHVVLCFAKKDTAYVVDCSDCSEWTIPHGTIPNAAAYSPAGDLIAVVGERELQICSAHDGRDLVRKPLNGAALSVAFSHDGTKVACGGRFNGILILKSNGEKNESKLTGGRDTECLAFSPDDSLLAAGQSDGVIRVWDTATGDLRAELVGHERQVADVAFAPDGAQFDYGVNRWDDPVMVRRVLPLLRNSL